MGLTMKEKQVLTREYAPRYRKANRKTKSGILDEYVRLTGYHRKYGMALLKRWGKAMLMLVEGKPVKLKAGTVKRRKGGGRKALHVVSAWVGEQRLTLGQLATEEKSNEITAIPTLLEAVALEGCVVTIDARGCQYKIAGQIIAARLIICLP
jgi:hypothetical protein